MLHKSETDAVTTWISSAKQRRQVGPPEKNLPRGRAKLSSLGRCKEKLFNKRTPPPLLFLPKKNHRCLFHFQWWWDDGHKKSQTVCVDNFVKERRFRKPIISLGTLATTIDQELLFKEVEVVSV